MLEPQIVGFLLWATGFILGLSISYLIGKVVQAEQVEAEVDNVQIAAYRNTADVRERFGQRG